VIGEGLVKSLVWRPRHGDYWDSPPLDRNQAHLFSPTLDAMIPQDHPVRLFDEILSQSDWLPWEARYPHGAGRPPIRPKVMASVILYGLSAGVRGSCRLEEACIVRTDFMWLTEGRQIDHSTICDFRTMFGKELKDTLRQVGRMAITLGLMRLNQIGLDGTRQPGVRAVQHVTNHVPRRRSQVPWHGVNLPAASRKSSRKGS